VPADPRPARGLIVAALALFAAVCGAAAPPAPAAGGADPGGAQASTVTPVEGLSVLHRLHLDIEATRMGQNGGGGEPPETSRVEPAPAGATGPAGPMGRLIQRFADLFQRGEDASAPLQTPFVLTGADLYRLNCRSCHGPDGAGAAPEIPSYVDAVRGASPALLRQRLEARGAPVDDAFVAQLAAGGEKDLRDRLLHGGEKMPAFPHLAGAEVDALLHYLKQQAGVPDVPAGEQNVTETVARVGEHLVKGTCHVCHDATGPGGGHMMMMRGVIPSLASFPSEKSPGDLIRKVRSGTSGMMMGMMGGERMPVFSYLTDEEIVAAYLYLEYYPPRP